MTASRILVIFCLSFTGGIFFASFYNLPVAFLLSLAIFAILLASVFWKYKRIAVFGFCVLFFLAGFVRCQSSESQATAEKEGVFNTFIVSDPDIRETSQRVLIKGNDFSRKALIMLPRYPEYEYGDEIEISGKLEQPDILEDFNYPGYLAKDGIFLVSYQPETKLISKGNGNGFLSAIFKIKSKVREVMSGNLPQSHAALLSAMVLGDRTQLPESLAQKLNLSGVRHMTSISGMHISILTAVLMSFLLGLGLWKKQAFWVTVIFISFFILFTGFQAPAVRSGIMGICFLMSQYLGRQNSSLRTILFSGALMLFLNPLVLVFDVGFQLSFLALLGILLLSPVFEKWLGRIPNKFQIRTILAMSLGAQIFTLPILVFNFGQFSLVAPFANILIVPALSYIMVLGFIFSAAGLAFPPLGFLFSLPCLLILQYLISVAGFFASLPFSALFFNVSWHWLVIYYVFLSGAVFFLPKKLKNNPI
jgi:competence protein ComEC